MDIPTPSQCRELMDRMKMPDHIRDHSLQVRRVACRLTDRLNVRGLQLNRRLVEAAALLHDITKHRSLETGEDHALTGDEFMTRLGFPRVGEIIRQHVTLDRYFASTVPDEAEVVNYADKRVLHDQVVTLKARMDYIFQCYRRFATCESRRLQFWEQAKQIEARLMDHAGREMSDPVGPLMA